MHYVCIENNVITTILNYSPNVPPTVQVIEISDSEHTGLVNSTHYFDVSTKKVMSINPAELDKKEQEKKNGIEREFLNSTDWKVLRHIRQKALGIPTTLTESEYLDLERQRDAASARIL